MEAEDALQYARHEDCFADYHKHPFDIAYQLSSLQHTTFAPQEDCLAEEHGRYSYDLPHSTFAIEEEPDRLASQLNEFEEKCRQSDFLPRMLPRWNHIYQNLPLPTRFIDLDFHPEVDLEDFIAQIRSKRDPDLAKVRLPILRVEDPKDEGLQFPLRAQRLAHLLWHELENERASTDADQEYMDEINQEADRVIKDFTTSPISSSRYLEKKFVEISSLPVPSQLEEHNSCDAESFVSVMDLTSEPEYLTMPPETLINTERQSSSPLRPQPIGSFDRDLVLLQDIHNVGAQKANGREESTSLEQDDPTASLDRHYCFEDFSAHFLQDAYDSSGETLVVSDEPREERATHTEVAEPSISKYFLFASAGHNTAKAHESSPPTSQLFGDNEEIHDARNEHDTTQAPMDPAVQPESSETNEVHVSTVPPGPSKELCNKKDTYNTSSLLSLFMEMRGVKSNRTTNSNPVIATTSKVMDAASTTKAQSVAQLSNNVTDLSRVDAMAPHIEVPMEPGCFLISVQLGHAMIRNVEEFWPADKLIDRDFEGYQSASHHSRGDKNISSLTFHTSEVDIPLTPNAGIVVATLLQVKQKPLPGSNTLTSLRKRILYLCQRYSTLVVLVSEANPSGEYMANLAASDLADYSDFVGFASKLATDVTVYLVPGAERTLSRWILSIVGQYNQQMRTCDETVTFCDTTWEMFLRQSGLNTRASLALSHEIFKEFGKLGVVKILTMTEDQLKSRYGALVGGEEVIVRTGRIWNDDSG